MNKYKRYIPIVALVLVALGVNLDQFGIDLKALSQGGSVISTSAESEQNSAPGNTQAFDRQPTGDKWSTTSPNINLWHIFEGEINRSGKPVGYHSRPNGTDAVNARVVSIRDQPNRAGVYTANIEIRDGQQWKGKFSTFFPDDLSRDQVINAILNAYENSANPKAQPFEGPSGLGFVIQGYTTSRGGINTAFPVYVRN